MSDTIIKGKLEKALTDITPYVAQQLSNHMNMRMDTIIVSVSPTGDIQAFGTVPEEMQTAVYTALLNRLEELKQLKMWKV